jgi:hypothetical protein
MGFSFLSTDAGWLFYSIIRRAVKETILMDSDIPACLHFGSNVGIRRIGRFNLFGVNIMSLLG